MLIKSLELRNFRNLEAQIFNPGPGINLILGDNGQGKTNLVEAISFLSWMRSFRTSRSVEMITSGQDAAWLSAKIDPGGRQMEVQLAGGMRKVRIDGHPIKAARDCLDILAVACLSPDDPAILEGGPSGRRQLLDRFMVMRRPTMGILLSTFERLLKERNALLKADAVAYDHKLLEAVSEALAKSAAELLAARFEALDSIANRLPDILAQMAGDDLGVEVGYQSKWFPKDAPLSRAQNLLLQAFHQRRDADFALGYTTAGPQADDMEVGLLGLPTRGHASRGQKKVLMLAWKVSEALEYQSLTGQTPALVLDDAFADLDASRQAGVVACLCDYAGQSFITSAVADSGVLANASVFFAKQGLLSAMEA